MTTTTTPAAEICTTDSALDVRRPSRRRTTGRIALAAFAATSLAVGGGFVGARVAAQADPVAPTTPSNYVSIDGYRAYDSRLDDGQKPTDGRRIVTLQRGVEGSIPSGAVAVAYSITVTATEGAGWAAIDGFGGVDGSAISTVAWTGPGQREVNSGIVPTFRGDVEGAHYVWLTIGGTDAAAHVIIDVVGYLLPAGGA